MLYYAYVEDEKGICYEHVFWSENALATLTERCKNAHGNLISCIFTIDPKKLNVETDSSMTQKSQLTEIFDSFQCASEKVLYYDRANGAWVLRP